MSKLYACVISPDVREDEQMLLSLAYEFAYRVELLEDGVLFDVSGLEKLVGDPKAIAGRVLDRLREHNISGNVAVANTVDAALLLAREAGGLNHTAACEERFRQLPLRNLEIAPDTIGVFEALGINSIEELQQVPADDLIARYGQDFREVIDLIGQNSKRTLTPNIKEKQVTWAYELDFPVDDFGQLIFIANRALDELMAQVSHYGFSTEQVDIHFRLENKAERSYEIKTSFPTLDKSFWLKLINLRISVDPPESEILSVRFVSHFTRPRPAQSGLYAASRPQPESLLLTVGKIKRLVGEENAGVPVMLEKRVEHTFALDADKLPAGRERIGETPMSPLIAFSYFSPPLPAEIFVRNRQLIYLRTQHFRGRVLAYSGVWRSNSQWWGRTPYNTQEWHVEVENGGVYRLIKKGDDWFVAGEFD